MTLPKVDHDVVDILTKLAAIETTLGFLAKREDVKADLAEAIKAALKEHREQFCYRLHPVFRKSGNGKDGEVGKIDFLKLAKFIGVLIGSAILAGSSGYFLGR